MSTVPNRVIVVIKEVNVFKSSNLTNGTADIQQEKSTFLEKDRYERAMTCYWQRQQMKLSSV